MKYSLQTVTILVATTALVGSISRGSFAQAATQAATPAAAQPNAAPPAAPATAPQAAPPATSPPVAAAPTPAPAAPPTAPTTAAPVAQHQILLLGPTEAPSEPEPSTGLALTITGGVLMGIGALNLATYPICDSKSLYPDQDKRDLCKMLSLGAGIGGLAVGVPLFIVGLTQRSRHKDWEASQRRMVTWVPRLHFGAANADLGGMSLVSRF